MSTLRDRRLAHADIQAFHFPDGIAASDIRSALASMEDPTWVPYREEEALVVTAMSYEAYASFHRQGKYRTVLDIGPTWHLTYNRDLATLVRGRVFNDTRLFGGPCVDSMTYGILLHRGAVEDTPQRIYDYMTRDFGDILVAWKWEAWAPHATVTVGDSQQNFITFPYAEDTVRKLVAIRRGKSGVPLLEAMVMSTANPYVEVQVHHQLTPDHVEGCFQVKSGRVTKWG